MTSWEDRLRKCTLDLIEGLKALETRHEGEQITGPDLAHAALWREVASGAGFERESLVVLALSTSRRILDCEVLTTGNKRFTIVDPAQIYRWALLADASAIIMAHVHPSGDVTPSSEDIRVTERVSAAGDVLGVPLIDHLILTENGLSSSMAELGHMRDQGRRRPLVAA